MLVLATLAAFWPVRHAGFVNWDDPQYVTANPQVRAGLTWAGFKWAFTTGHASSRYPMTWLSHMLDCELFGLNPAGHHLMNLLFHVANTLLVFLVLRRMTNPQSKVEILKSKVTPPATELQTPDSRPQTLDSRLQTPDSGLWRCGFVAALFALHPLHVESVAWVTERKDVLSAFFFLLTLWAYAKYVSGAAGQVSGVRLDAPRNPQHVSNLRPQASRHLPSSIYYLLALLCFALALMSKPMVVTLPFVLLLLDYWPLRRFTISPRNQMERTHVRCYEVQGKGELQPAPNHQSSIVNHKLGLLVEKLPFFLMSAFVSVVTFLTERHGQAMATADAFPLWSRLGNALVSYCRYIGKAFWPDNLTVFYPHPGSWPLWQVVGAAIVLALITLLAAWRARSKPYWPVGWLWFVGMLVPVIGIVQVGGQSLADRYTYLPLIGLCIVIVWTLADLAGDSRSRRVMLATVGGVVILALAGATHRQAGHWRDSESLFRHAVAVAPSAVAHGNLGAALAERHELAEARFHFETALRLNPNDSVAHVNLSNVLIEQANTEEAVRHLERALQINPNHGSALNNLAWLRATHREARFRDGAQAVQLAERARQAMDREDVHSLDTLAAAYAEAGLFVRAVAAAGEAVKLAEAAGQTALADQIRQRVVRYEAGKPYRE